MSPVGFANPRISTGDAQKSPGSLVGLTKRPSLVYPPKTYHVSRNMVHGMRDLRLFIEGRPLHGYNGMQRLNKGGSTRT